MEDEEYYHRMVEDMERLVRVHHHVERPDPPRRQRSLRSPWASGLWLVFSGAIREALTQLRWAAMWKRSTLGS
jgi:hypothetical protein